MGPRNNSRGPDHGPPVGKMWERCGKDVGKWKEMGKNTKNTTAKSPKTRPSRINVNCQISIYEYPPIILFRAKLPSNSALKKQYFTIYRYVLQYIGMP